MPISLQNLKTQLSLVILCILLAGAISIPPAHAQSLDDVKAALDTLQEVITSIHTELQLYSYEIELQRGVVLGTATGCVDLSYTLSYGSTDTETKGEVSKLQTFLAEDSDIYPEGLVTGFYGSLTEKAVQRWQKEHKIVNGGTPKSTGFGVVGSKTRSAMREHCTADGGTSDSGGETADSGGGGGDKGPQITISSQQIPQGGMTYTEASPLAVCVNNIPGSPMMVAIHVPDYDLLDDGRAKTLGIAGEDLVKGAGCLNLPEDIDDAWVRYHGIIPGLVDPVESIYYDGYPYDFKIAYVRYKRGFEHFFADKTSFVVVPGAYSGVSIKSRSSNAEFKENEPSTVDDDEAVFTYSLDVTAVGNDVYIPKTVSRGTTITGGGINYVIERSFGQGEPSGSSEVSLSSNANEVGGYYHIPKDATRTLNLTVEYTPDGCRTGGECADGTEPFRLQIYSVNFNTVPATPNVKQVPKPQDNYQTVFIDV